MQPVAGEKGHLAAAEHPQHDWRGGWSERSGHLARLCYAKCFHSIQACPTNDSNHVSLSLR